MKSQFEKFFPGIYLIVATCVIGLASLLVGPPVQTQAATSELPPRKATPTLPVTPTPKRSDKVGAPIGAYLELRVEATRPDAWTVVQWQNIAGNWEVADGWEGSLDPMASGLIGKVWWVAKADFQKGPFRWVIYDRRGGEILAISAPFYLPQEVNQVVAVEISLKQ